MLKNTNRNNLMTEMKQQFTTQYDTPITNIRITIKSFKTIIMKTSQRHIPKENIKIQNSNVSTEI